MTTKEGHLRSNLGFRRYLSSRSDDWLVLLPGAGAASAVWRRQIPFFKRSYNLIVIDLPGHGRSPKGNDPIAYTFEAIAAQIVDLLREEGIERAHFLSMSLGGLVAETIALVDPKRVESLVLAGGIAKLSWWATFLMYLGRVSGPLVPYMVLYRFFAWIIMPGANHASTRRLFRAHAQRLGRAEFLRWYSLCGEVNELLRRSEGRSTLIPSLFVMGREDYMFYTYALERERRRPDTSVKAIKNCGHVCSVERPDDFNTIAEEFLLRQKRKELLNSEG